MKNFYYAFTQKGTTKVWFTLPYEKPEIETLLSPAHNLPVEMNAQDNENLPIGQNSFTRGVAAKIEHLHLYNSKYRKN